MADAATTMPFSDVLARLTGHDGAFTVEPSAEWRQGRTLFGGLSAALAIASAAKAFPELPTLRAAEFAFIGPAAGALALTPKILRAGKSATFVEVEGRSGSELALNALLLFGVARRSNYSYRALAMPAVAPPDGLPGPFSSPGTPGFFSQFDVRIAGGALLVSGAKKPEQLLWIRHRDAQAPDAAASIIALGDVPPPAAMTMFTQPAPISTVTWSVEILEDKFSGAGWHLIHVEAETVNEGYSSQRMVLWDAGGTPLLSARQTVAVFG